MEKLIISYDFGYSDWYVSEFYNFFYKKIIDDFPNIKFEFVPLHEFALKFDDVMVRHATSLFNWYNLIIYNPKSEKLFVHSWYDYAPEIIDYCINKNFNVVKFSCVSNLTDEILVKYKDKINIQPSVFYLENWSDVKNIQNITKKEKINKTFFNGLNHGHREKIMNFLVQKDFFNIKSKTKLGELQSKKEYFNELSNHKFGLSLNGAANICYRDLELFGLGVLNLRQPLICNSFNPIIKDVHYIEFLDQRLFDSIIDGKYVDDIIDFKVNQILEFSKTSQYNEMIFEGKKWFQENCLPENQYKILLYLLEDFTIF